MGVSPPEPPPVALRARPGALELPGGAGTEHPPSSSAFKLSERPGEADGQTSELPEDECWQSRACSNATLAQATLC